MVSGPLLASFLGFIGDRSIAAAAEKREWEVIIISTWSRADKFSKSWDK